MNGKLPASLALFLPYFDHHCHSSSLYNQGIDPAEQMLFLGEGAVPLRDDHDVKHLLSPHQVLTHDVSLIDPTAFLGPYSPMSLFIMGLP